VSLSSLLSRERTIAGPAFSRWLVPPAALCVHLCIGQVYAFSVFNLPMTAFSASRVRSGRLETDAARLDILDRDPLPGPVFSRLPGAGLRRVDRAAPCLRPRCLLGRRVLHLGGRDQSP
jgi:hypothetical protein